MPRNGTIAAAGVDHAPVREHGGRRCKVLHLVSTFAIKTDTKWLLQIARYLDPRRFALSAACFYAGGEIAPQLEQLGVETHNLDVPAAADPRAVLRARRLIEAIDPDLVHTHLLRADLLGGVAARTAGVPVIVSTAYAIGAFRRAEQRRSDGLLDGLCRLLPTHVLAVCEAVRDDCIGRWGFPPERVTVIRTGVDAPPPFEETARASWKRQWTQPGDGPLIVTVARLSYEKGVDVLIDAMAIVAAARTDARSVVVGEGPQRRELESRIRRHGLEGVVRLAGFRRDVELALASADVVAVPSLMEGMPNVLLEAMAAGRPIVASDVGGIPEALANERCGLLVPPANAPALAAAIGRLLADRPAAQALGRAAADEVQRRCLARDVVARYGQWYESLIHPLVRA